MSKFGHDHLCNRYIFEGKLEVVTPIRISSGRASATTDAPFIKTLGGIPYIPGSSLRGAIRSEIERIIASVGDSFGMKSCILFEKDKDNCAVKISEFLRDFAEERNDGSAKNEKIAEFAEKELCDVCKLFGSTIYASRLVIEDAPSAAGTNTPACIRDGVGIDRDTGAARDGVKFDYEVIEKGRFKFRMAVENMTPQDKKMLELILNLLKQGLYVGGKRAAGLGKIQLQNLCISGFSDPSIFFDNLTTKKSLYTKIENLGGVIPC